MQGITWKLAYDVALGSSKKEDLARIRSLHNEALLQAGSAPQPATLVTRSLGQGPWLRVRWHLIQGIRHPCFTGGPFTSKFKSSNKDWRSTIGGAPLLHKCCTCRQEQRITTHPHAVNLELKSKQRSNPNRKPCANSSKP